MKKFYIVVALLTILFSCSPQLEIRQKEILKSTSIDEVTEYLKNAHPEDPKKRILEGKLIALKNKEWTKGAANAKPMEARPVIMNVPSNHSKAQVEDSEEYKRLLSETAIQHQKRTKELLNSMLDKDVSNNEAILLFKNNSDCNLVLKINGKKFYNLAVPAHNDNFLILEKGNYSITTNVCDVKYNTQKVVKNHLQLSIGNPIDRNENEKKSLAKSSDIEKVKKKVKKRKYTKKKS
ncbi:DUF6759 domain-containing protein [Chryseobacterium sp.]|uniref:DUF6759 domain-containing protein n=1 Tax=Chryseobacterium sp. TaxID=1871047 RepID=UPI00388F9C61